MDAIELNAKIRSTLGNGPARALRRDGRIPAVLYGPETKPILLSVHVKEMETALKKGSIGQSLFTLAIEGGNAPAKTILIKELQTHPLTKNFIHADFYEIDMNRKLVVSIPVTTTGKAKGVEEGGVLQIIRRELEVSCLPGQIPESIKIDISHLDIGDAVHVEDIAETEGIELLYDVNFTVITVVAPKTDETEKPVADAEEDEDVEKAEAEEKTD